MNFQARQCCQSICITRRSQSFAAVRGLASLTPFHGENTGSSPVGITILKGCLAAFDKMVTARSPLPLNARCRECMPVWIEITQVTAARFFAEPADEDERS